MKLAFYKGGNNLVDKVIKARTNGTLAHVELLFSDGSSFSSSQWDHGTRFVKELKLNDSWLVVEVGQFDEVAIRAWCTTQLGKGYDWLSLVHFFEGVPEKPAKDPNTWFCSEICTAALQSQGIFTFLVPEETSPEELYIAAAARQEIKAAA